MVRESSTGVMAYHALLHVGKRRHAWQLALPPALGAGSLRPQLVGMA